MLRFDHHDVHARWAERALTLGHHVVIDKPTNHFPNRVEIEFHTDAANLTLLQALRSLCLRAQRWGQPQGVEVSLLAAAPDEAVTQTLSPECALHLYKATHEAVSNALRHSGARRISLQLSVQAHELQLVVEDDGNGIPGWNAELQSTSATPMTAMGLRGMQHRLQSIGGHCLIHSNANGTRLEMRLRLETRG